MDWHDKFLLRVKELEMLKEVDGEFDPVEAPAHYNLSPARCGACGDRIECIDITRHMNFCLGNAIKYIWRESLKGNSVEDLRKAIKYLEFEIGTRENCNENR